jgi:hypothetical protein
LNQHYGHLGLNVEEDILKRAKDIMIDTYLSVRRTINPHNRKNSFELLGYDFLIDEDFRVWLIEVNTNPYIGVPNNYIKKLLPELMDDLLEIVLDTVVPCGNSQSKRSNAFELLYS